MDDDLLCFLRAFLTELVGRYFHLQQFVELTRRGARDGTPNLLIRYGELLQKKTRLLLGFSETISDLPKDAITARELEGPFRTLLNESREFQSLHKALKWFPTPWPGSELFQFLTQLGRERGVAFKFDTLNPTAVLSDEYNFLTSDVNQELPVSDSRSNLVVWALPKGESTNPLLWPVLTHEVAHSFYGRRELEPTIAGLLSVNDNRYKEVLISWAIELNADLLAFRLLGPAYLYSLMYFSIFFITSNLRTPVRPERADLDMGLHPAPETRIRLLSTEADSLKERLKNKDRKKEEYSPQLKRVWKALDQFTKLYEARLRLDHTAQPFNQDDYDGFPNQVVDKVWDAIRTFQHNDLPDVDITVKELETSVDLADRLARRQLAASVVPNPQGISCVKEFVESVENSGRDEVLDRLDERRPSRDEVLDGLDERPASMAEILNGGWQYKTRILHGSPLFKVKPTELKNGQTLESYSKDNFLEQSRQLQKSIQTAIILASISRFADTPAGIKYA